MLVMAAALNCQQLLLGPPSGRELSRSSRRRVASYSTATTLASGRATVVHAALGGARRQDSLLERSPKSRVYVVAEGQHWRERISRE